jgi:hypothetical protein
MPDDDPLGDVESVPADAELPGAGSETPVERDPVGEGPPDAVVPPSGWVPDDPGLLDGPDEWGDGVAGDRRGVPPLPGAARRRRAARSSGAAPGFS